MKFDVRSATVDDLGYRNNTKKMQHITTEDFVSP